MLDPDTYAGWKKDTIKALKEWDKAYIKHQKSINPEVHAIHMQAFKPLTELWEANLNFHHINNMIASGVQVPVFRFEALEEQFVLKVTRICEIFRDYGNLDNPFDIRQMLTVLKIPNWKDIHPFAYFLQPLEDAINDVVKCLLDMQKEGHLRAHYIIERNLELMEKVNHMVRTDVTCQWLMGDELRQDQLKFIYNVHKTVYDTGLKDTYIDPKKNEHILQQVVTQVCALHSMLNIREIDDQKALDAKSAIEKQARKEQLMAQTGINFDPEPEPVAEVPEEKTTKKSKKKEPEIDPEELERQLQAKLKAEDIAKYGVSRLNSVTVRSAPGSGSNTTTRRTQS